MEQKAKDSLKSMNLYDWRKIYEFEDVSIGTLDKEMKKKNAVWDVTVIE